MSTGTKRPPLYHCADCSASVLIVPDNRQLSDSYDYYAQCTNTKCAHAEPVDYDPQRPPSWVKEGPLQ